MKGPYFVWLCLSLLLLCGCSKKETGPVVQEFEVYCSIQEVISVTEKPQEMNQSGTVSVTFQGTSGPTSLQVSILYKTQEDSAYKLRTVMPLALQESFSFQLPEGSLYKIEATATQGQSGYITILAAAG